MEIVFSEETEKKIVALKKKLQKNTTPQDIVAAIFYYFKGDKILFTTDYEKIHNAFYKFKEDSLFDEFSYRNMGLYYWSENLENSLSGLSISRLLTRHNPIYQIYEINSKQKEQIKNTILIKFKDDQKKRIQEISSEIEKEIRRDNI